MSLDCDCGAGEIHVRVREILRQRNAKGGLKISLIFGAHFVLHRLRISRAWARVFHPPHNHHRQN